MTPIPRGLRNHGREKRGGVNRYHLFWPLLLVTCFAVVTAHQIGVWRSNLTLWRHAMVVSPYKPRVAHNYGLALLEVGETDAAIAQLRAAATLAEAPHVPAWDRRITNRDVAANMRMLRAALRRR